MTAHTRLIHAAQVRGLALVALSVSLSVSLCASLFSGCDPQSLPPTADLSGLTQLAFQCVNLKTRPAETAPLERCGCLSASLSDEGARVLSEVSGSECTTDPNFRILGYLGSSTQEKVGVVDLKSEVRGIFDQDQSIPGISHFSAGGLISSLRVHPYGDFMFIVRGDTGEVALSSDYRDHQPNLSVNLEQGPLSFSAIWPKENQLLPEDGSPSYLYVSAPLRNRILEVDLDLLSLALTDALAGEEIGSRDVITRTWDLTDERGAPIAPGQLSINTSGDLLSVAHADTPRITLISLDPSAADTPERGAAVLGDIDLHPRLTCADTYIVEPLIVTRAAETCVDGIDNDQDGFIDQDDLKCALYKTEALDLACPQSDTCADGVDNDQDDLVDAEDPDCDEVSDDGERREGSAPECDDGIDNDGDGLIDRADDGCADQRDPREAYTLERGELCEDGEDNDSDGLIDDEDPGCSDPDGAQRYLFERRAECSDGLDNDGDGLIDYPEDLDCTHAASHRESPLFPARGPQLLEIVTLELASGTREVIVTDGPDGALLLIDVLSADEVDVPSLPADPEADDQSPLFFKQTPLFDISYPHSLEVISSGELTTLWVIDQNTTLHTVHLSAPVPARTVTGERIYAQGEIGAPSTETASPSGEVERVIDVEAYYIVRDGVAYQLPLDALLGEIPYDPLTQVPMVSEEINAELQTLDPTALSELPRLALSDSGADAPEVFLDLDYQRAETRWNRYRTALSQSNRVVAEPKFSLNDVRVNANVTRHVGFCELSTLSERDETQTDDEESNTGACDLVGGLVSAEVDELNKSTLVSYRGVVSTEERHDFVISGRVGVAYEGAIPNSRQNNGRHIGQGEDTWRLANEQSDFCALGVEEGDLVIVDRFYPQDAAAASDPECRPFIQRTPGEGVDPLRYRVSKVSQRALTLTTDPRDSYAPQLDLLGSSRLPKLAPALPPPPARCAAQTISYEIRVGRDQWLVESNALGYRHPWVARDGECVRSPERVSRRQVGRARLGEVYAGEWFTFKLGYQAASAGQGGIPTGQLPLMVGTRYDFFMERGALRAPIQSVGPAPQSIRWLPELNRLFIVDVALKQVSEYTGLDPYLETIRAFTVFR